MSNLGHVFPGGPAVTVESAQSIVTKFSVGSMDNNVYVITCRQTGTRLLVDAADDAARILEVLDGDNPTTVVTTHRHWDHVRALTAIVSETGAVSLAHPDDADEIPVVTATVRGGDVITCGDLGIEVVHLVGHTPGSIALCLSDSVGPTRLFTGDSLFPGGTGKVANRTDFLSLITDVETKLFDRFDDATIVHPGHGDDTTLGAERPHLPQWRARGWLPYGPNRTS